MYPLIWFALKKVANDKLGINSGQLERIRLQAVCHKAMKDTCTEKWSHVFVVRVFTCVEPYNEEHEKFGRIATLRFIIIFIFLFFSFIW